METGAKKLLLRHPKIPAWGARIHALAPRKYEPPVYSIESVMMLRWLVSLAAPPAVNTNVTGCELSA